MKTRSQLEQLWASHYSCEDVRDCVEDLLQVESDYGKLMAEIDKATQAVEDELALDVANKGDHLPGDLSLVEATTGEPLQLEKLWIQAPFTLFVLRKHYV